MNIFKRLFKIGSAEAHSAIDKLEDPIKLTEQGIRDLKKDLDNALKALAEVKALAIRARNEAETQTLRAKDYEQKAMLLLQKAQNGQLEMAEADRLATESLTKKAEADQHIARANKEREQFDASVSKLENQIKHLRNQISKYENELKTLKARVKVSTATKNINKQMSQIDSTGTVSMLERMKEKVEQEEALAEAYGDIADESKSVDDEINKALGDVNATQANDSLAALKAKMGLNKDKEQE